MTPYDRLRQAVRDGDTGTVMFLLIWLEVGLPSLDHQHGTNHMETVDGVLGEAFRYLEARPEALA